jgi:hypothetical protein
MFASYAIPIVVVLGLVLIDYLTTRRREEKAWRKKWADPVKPLHDTYDAHRKREAQRGKPWYKGNLRSWELSVDSVPLKDYELDAETQAAFDDTVREAQSVTDAWRAKIAERKEREKVRAIRARDEEIGEDDFAGETRRAIKQAIVMLEAGV